MTRKFELQGFEQLPSSDTGNLVFFRRPGDQQVTGACSERNGLDVTGNLPLAAASQTIRVYTLGRFSLLLHGQPAMFGRKTPQRPLELLKAIIACGGRDIGHSMLTAALWPDSNGDDAKRALDTTLFRLRKILGDDRAISQREGKVSLDSRYCWTDVWAFERLLGRVNRIRNLDAAGKDALLLEQMTTQLQTLYQDHFLGCEDVTSWSVSLRERLRSKYLHNLLETGRYLETHGFWQAAMVCYQKGLDVDDLVEAFYQRLMLCYLHMQRYSEGMAIYRRCCRMLSVVLGLQPEAETENIYNMLRHARAS